MIPTTLNNYVFIFFQHIMINMARNQKLLSKSKYKFQITMKKNVNIITKTITSTMRMTTSPAQPRYICPVLFVQNIIVAMNTMVTSKKTFPLQYCQTKN